MTRLISTPIPEKSHLVRFMDGPNSYDRMIVVTELDGGEVLFLQGWIGKPLSHNEWRAARDLLFPNAREVRFERMRDGEMCPRRLFP